MNYETTLEDMFEASLVGSVFNPAVFPDEHSGIGIRIGQQQEAADHPAEKSGNTRQPDHQCSASEGGCAQNTNRATAALASEPIDCAGVSVSTPPPQDGDANNSTGDLNSAGARKTPAGFFSPPFFFKSIMKSVPTAGACLDNKQPSEGQAHNGYSAIHKRAQSHERFH